MKVDLVPILKTVQSFFPGSKPGTARESNVIYVNNYGTIASIYYDWQTHKLICKPSEKMMEDKNNISSVYKNYESMAKEIEHLHILPKWRRSLISLNPFIEKALEFTYISAYAHN